MSNTREFIQSGASCDYCGQGIMTVFTIKSSDGKTFKVGCDCVARTARACARTGLERDARRVLDQMNKLKTAAANARKDERITAGRAVLEANRDKLAGMIVSDGRQDRNALDRLEWLFIHAGRAGKLRAAATLGALLSGAA